MRNVFQCRDELLEDSAPVFVVVELVEAGAGGGEENGVSGLGSDLREGYGLLEGACPQYRGGAGELGADFFRGGTNGEYRGDPVVE